MGGCHRSPDSSELFLTELHPGPKAPPEGPHNGPVPVDWALGSQGAKEQGQETKQARLLPAVAQPSLAPRPSMVLVAMYTPHT